MEEKILTAKKKFSQQKNNFHNKKILTATEKFSQQEKKNPTMREFFDLSVIPNLERSP